MRQAWIPLLASLLIMAGTAACGAAGNPPTAASAPASTPTITPSPLSTAPMASPTAVTVPSPGPGDEPTEAVRIARDDLARRLGVSPDSIAVVAILRQEFPADAFYCRTTKERTSRDEPPATISGESILLSAADRRYEYHASDQTVIFCRQLP